MAGHVSTPAERLQALRADDFDLDDARAAGWEQLALICDDLRDHHAVMDCADEMFAVMERLDAVDLGTPGPLVHALERTGGRYEAPLMDSIRRKPSLLAVWMINRILNVDRSDRAAWLEMLEMAAHHPGASNAAREDARGFLEQQVGRDSRPR